MQRECQRRATAEESIITASFAGWTSSFAGNDCGSFDTFCWLIGTRVRGLRHSGQPGFTGPTARGALRPAPDRMPGIGTYRR